MKMMPKPRKTMKIHNIRQASLQKTMSQLQKNDVITTNKDIKTDENDV